MSDQLRQAANQAISNMQGISNMTDDPHVQEIAHVTADLLGEALRDSPCGAAHVVTAQEFVDATTLLIAEEVRKLHESVAAAEQIPHWYEHG